MTEKLTFSMQTVFQLNNIEKVCFGKEAWTVNNLVAEFNNEFSHMFAERDGDKIVGYVCMRVMYEEAQICNVAVLPEYRRRGIATRLLERVAEYAAEQGCERCELEVNTANTPTVELYKKCGYEIAGTRPNFYRRSKRFPSRDAYTMIYRFDQAQVCSVDSATDP